jgi:hypothetical protein
MLTRTLTEARNSSLFKRSGTRRGTTRRVVTASRVGPEGLGVGFGCGVGVGVGIGRGVGVGVGSGRGVGVGIGSASEWEADAASPSVRFVESVRVLASELGAALMLELASASVQSAVNRARRCFLHLKVFPAS